MIHILSQFFQSLDDHKVLSHDFKEKVKECIMSDHSLDHTQTSPRLKISQNPIHIFQAQAPSNIALVKYWGKKSFSHTDSLWAKQVPMNPSLSLTLNQAQSWTALIINSPVKDQTNVEKNLWPSQLPFYFYDREILSEKTEFTKKFENLILAFANYSHLLPTDFFHHWKNTRGFFISTNTFPHSSGIASSASGIAAVTLCLYQYFLYFKMIPNLSLEDLSSIARLGSGSAARSLDGPWMIWGDDSSEEKMPAYRFTDLHPKLQTELAVKNDIYLISMSEKKTSSRFGHQLMKNHPYREGRIIQAQKHFQHIKIALKNYDLDSLISIIESEALSLHACLLSSHEPTILFTPETFWVWQELTQFRQRTQFPLSLTLDAGANLHCLLWNHSEDHPHWEEYQKLKIKISKNICGVFSDFMGTGANWRTFCE